MNSRSSRRGGERVQVVGTYEQQGTPQSSMGKGDALGDGIVLMGRSFG